MTKFIIVFIIIFLLLAIGILDAQNVDNSLYHSLQIGSLKYYDIPIWSFLQSIGTVVAVMSIYLAYEKWMHERKPTIHATGSFFISKYTENNNVRDDLIKEFQTLQLVNVGKGPANNVIISEGKDNNGKVLEDSCPHAFSIPSNQGTQQFREVLRVHGDSNPFKVVADRSHFYIRYQDHKRKTYYTKVTIQRVKQADGKVGEKISNSLQMWKVIENEEAK